MFIVYQDQIMNVDKPIMDLFPELHDGQHVTKKVFWEVLIANCRYGIIITTNLIEKERLGD